MCYVAVRFLRSLFFFQRAMSQFFPIVHASPPTTITELQGRVRGGAKLPQRHRGRVRHGDRGGGDHGRGLRKGPRGVRDRRHPSPRVHGARFVEKWVVPGNRKSEPRVICTEHDVS